MIVFVLVGICIAAFIAQTVIPGFTGLFVLVSAQVLERPWTLVTAIFLHGDLGHLLFNMFALTLFGAILESIVGRKKFLLIFFVGGVIASIGSIFLYKAALGASGAIFAILGTLAILRPKMQVWVSFVPRRCGQSVILLDYLYPAGLRIWRISLGLDLALEADCTCAEGFQNNEKSRLMKEVRS
ncbi:rhomboid family intramembrane serine protease [Candidatus Woesearchaeota archaeon]|nr:rhomboid family intramembrane serine protease [Candidatus Woesearchaeota archaeon]